MSGWLLVLVVSVPRAGPAVAAPAVDAEKPASAPAPVDPWPVAVVDRPLTLPRGMAVASLASQSYWSPGVHGLSYFGPTASVAVHDRVEIGGGLPFAFCWDGGSNRCAGGSSLDRANLGLAFALRRSAGFSLAGGVTASIERNGAPAEHRTAIWLTGKRTWFHRLSLFGIARLDIGWEHPVLAPVSAGDPGQLRQLNQTRLYWTEQVMWQVVDRLAVYAYFNPYRPLGAPGDESWATRAGGGATLALGQRWLLGVDCEVENIMPVRQWQYVPHAKGCRVSVGVFRLPQ